MSNCIALYLAAGLSTRFGSNKLDYKLKDGRSILQASIDIAVKAGIAYKVVVKPGDRYDFLGKDDVAVCEDYQDGMAASIRAGIESISRQYSSCLICLADMPFIDANTFTQLANTIENKDYKIVIPVNEDRILNGHPVAIRKEVFSDFKQLVGDTGGRAIINKYSADVYKLTVSDCNIYRDIDVLNDLIIDE